jgi:hypothetical protein
MAANILYSGDIPTVAIIKNEWLSIIHDMGSWMLCFRFPENLRSNDLCQPVLLLDPGTDNYKCLEIPRNEKTGEKFHNTKFNLFDTGNLAFMETIFVREYSLSLRVLFASGLAKKVCYSNGIHIIEIESRSYAVSAKAGGIISSALLPLTGKAKLFVWPDKKVDVVPDNIQILSVANGKIV